MQSEMNGKHSMIKKLKKKEKHCPLVNNHYI